MIELINGPYNGRIIEDLGATTIRMSVYDGGERIGAQIGEATYEPTEDRTKAFYSDTTWLGTLEGSEPA